MQWPLASSGCPLCRGLSSTPATPTKLMGAAFPPHVEEKHPWDTLPSMGPCVGLLHIQAGACECRGKAGGEQPFPDPCLLSPDVVWENKLPWRLHGEVGCWLASSPSLSGSWAHQQRAEQPVLLLLKHEPKLLLLSVEEPFISGTAALAASPKCPFSLPREVRVLPRSITGVSAATDCDATGVGNSAWDSDFIVALKLRRLGRSPKKTLNPQVLPKPGRCVRARQCLQTAWSRPHPEPRGSLT